MLWHIYEIENVKAQMKEKPHLIPLALVATFFVKTSRYLT